MNYIKAFMSQGEGEVSSGFIFYKIIFIQENILVQSFLLKDLFTILLHVPLLEHTLNIMEFFLVEKLTMPQAYYFKLQFKLFNCLEKSKKMQNFVGKF
jgi:hypothetical protein